MPSANPKLAARGRANALRRYRKADDPVLVDAERELAFAGLEEHIRDDAAKVSVEHRHHLAHLLLAIGGDAT